MIAVGLALLLGCGGTTVWRDTVRLDTLVRVKARDTLKILVGTQVMGLSNEAGIVVAGALVMAGDGPNRIGIQGGRGIVIEPGGSAFLSGVDISKTNFGIVLRGGEATLWDCRMAAGKGRNLVEVQAGDLVMARATLRGSSPLLVGIRGSIELDDVVLESDTLWKIAPEVRTRFQDVEAGGGVRIGQDPEMRRTHLPVPPDTKFHLRWATGPSWGTRFGNEQATRGVGTIPVSIAAGYGTFVGASLVTGWRRGWLGDGLVFDERDQTLARIQMRAFPFLEVGIEGGWGGSTISWDAQKERLATGLLDLSMELDEPFASPGPVAGGRARLMYQTESGFSTEAGMGYQWRGSSGSLDLGDLVSGWMILSGEDQGRHLGLLVDGVYCLPDKLSGVEGDPHWQWNALFSHRQNLPKLEYGGELGFEGRDDDVLAERIVIDLLFGRGALRAGPTLMEMAGKGTRYSNSAFGPGMHVKFRPSTSLTLDGTSWVRRHDSKDGLAWWGVDLTLKASGGF